MRQTHEQHACSKEIAESDRDQQDVAKETVFDIMSVDGGPLLTALSILLQHPYGHLTLYQLFERLLHIVKIDERTALHEAARVGNSDEIKSILKNETSIDINAVDDNRQTALHVALTAGSLESVRTLLQHGASTKSFDLPPSSFLDIIYILFRITVVAFNLSVLAWIVSFAGISNPLGSLGIHKPGIMALAAYICMFYVLSVASMTWSVMSSHFRPESLIQATLGYKGNDAEEMVLLLLDAGLQPTSILEGWSELWVAAARKGQVKVCSRLLEKQFPVDYPFESDAADEGSDVLMTALLWACAKSQKDMAAMLLERGADPSQLDSRGWSCLLHATMRWYGSSNQTVEDSDAIIELLLSTGTRKYLNYDHFEGTEEQSKQVFEFKWGLPLSEACRNKRPSTVRLLLDHGADPNLANNIGVTAIHAATRACDENEDTILLEMLVAAGADVNATTSDSWTAAGLVCNYGVSPSALRFLLDAGASTEMGAGENTPLQIAARHDVTEGGQLLHILLEHRAAVNATGGTYGSALLALLNRPRHSRPTVRVQNELIHMAESLVRRGADVNLTPKGYQSPIEQAAIHNWPLVVNYLLEQGSRLPPTKVRDISDVGFKFPRQVLDVSILSYVEPQYEQVIVMLLQRGANPNVDTMPNSFGGWVGMSALSAACESSIEISVKSVEHLLGAGADPNRLDPEGLSALHRATYSGNSSAILLLLEHGARQDVFSREHGSIWHSLCKGAGRRGTESSGMQSFKEISELLEQGINLRDTSAMWKQDGQGKNCFHHLSRLSEATHLMMNIKTREVSQSESPAVRAVMNFVRRYCHLHPAVLLDEDESGHNVFHIAASLGDVDMMEAILDFARFLGNIDSETSEESKQVVQALVISVDEQDHTALHLAAAGGHAIACEYLVEMWQTASGSSRMPVTKTGASPEDMARANGHEIVASYLATFALGQVVDEALLEKRKSFLDAALKDYIVFEIEAEDIGEAIGSVQERKDEYEAEWGDSERQ